MRANDRAGMLNGQPEIHQPDKVPAGETYDISHAELRATLNDTVNVNTICHCSTKNDADRPET